MTGRIRYSKTPELFRWDKIRFEFEKNSEKFYLNFTDTRKFGKVRIVENVNLNSGIEPFDLTPEKIQTLIQKIKKKNTEIKNILLDQKIISGLGNIYSNDSFFYQK